MQRVYEENEWGKVSKRIVTGRGSDGGCRCSDINSQSQRIVQRLTTKYYCLFCPYILCNKATPK